MTRKYTYVPGGHLEAPRPGCQRVNVTHQVVGVVQGGPSRTEPAKPAARTARPRAHRRPRRTRAPADEGSSSDPPLAWGRAA